MAWQPAGPSLRKPCPGARRPPRPALQGSATPLWKGPVLARREEASTPQEEKQGRSPVGPPVHISKGPREHTPQARLENPRQIPEPGAAPSVPLGAEDKLCTWGALCSQNGRGQSGSQGCPGREHRTHTLNCGCRLCPRNCPHRPEEKPKSPRPSEAVLLGGCRGRSCPLDGDQD